MTARARWRDRIQTSPAARAADTIHDLRVRVNIAAAILAHRPFCPPCQAHVDQARRALAGASIDQLTHYEDTS